jgi:hypothetical protein
MIISAKDFFSVIQDRDYLTVFFLLVFCLSVAGVSMGHLSMQESALLLLAVILSRLLFIFRADMMLESLSARLIERMDAERAKPNFRDGNLSAILDSEFAKIAGTVKIKCLEKLESDMDVDRNSAGDYIFYPTKVYDQPGKDRRRTRQRPQ